ncbi:hypothetical protein MASR2M15_16170 [Anaerolineales bacterium]
MRLFISYARVDKAICAKIVDALDTHDIFFDSRLYMGQDWWAEILKNLHLCEGFIYLMSPESIESKFCRKEFFIARKLNKCIFPILIDPDTKVPALLAKLHYINYTEASAETTKHLLKSIFEAERQGRCDQHASKIDMTGFGSPEDATDSPNHMVENASKFMDRQKFDDAIFILQQIKRKYPNLRYIEIDKMLKIAQRSLNKQLQEKTMMHDYRTIHTLIMSSASTRIGCQAFLQFQKDYPHYDPENLSERCARFLAPPRQPKIASLYQDSPRDREQEIIPPQSPPLPASKPRSSDFLSIEWIKIPAGPLILNLSEDAFARPQTVYVDRFWMSKYPITNDQYDIFLKAPDGYNDMRWWNFSHHARNWRIQNPRPLPGHYQGGMLPRENINWYDALAFCQWLSSRLKARVTLPTQYQWRRAARADQALIYPWGNEWIPGAANTRELNRRRTSPVQEFKDFASPFGLVDMAGNTWDWCLNIAYGIETDIASNQPRSVQGGAFSSTHERVTIDFNFHMDPDYYYKTIGFRVVGLPG